MKAKIEEKLKGRIVKWEEKNPKRHYIEIKKDDLRETTEFLFRKLGLRFCIATGIDNIKNMEVIYHFSDDKTGVIYSFRVFTERDGGEIPTISDIIKGAKWIEREIHELLGINFPGNEDLSRLLLDPSWPKGVFPLRKDYEYGRKEELPKSVCSMPTIGAKTGGKDRTIIPIGPYHPLQEEPEFFELEVFGEKVVKVNINLGYNHRGIEKISEGKHWDQVTFLVERICGICSTSHPFAYVLAVEDLLGLEIPERAKYIRSVIGEIERIHSHLLWLGLAGHFLGYNTVWMWAWKYREPVLDLAEQISGNRNHYAMMKIGGVRRDILNSEIDGMKEKLNSIVSALKMFQGAVQDDPIIKARTKNVGTLSRQDAIYYCVIGPTARPSGITMDIRKIDIKNSAYGLVDWNVIATENGDVYDKVVCRILEMFESVKIINQCFDRLKTLKEGEICEEVREIPKGEGIGRYEAPRGEVWHYVRSDGGNTPVRHKIRAPSYMNVASNEVAAAGGTVSDAAITLAAVDPCYCCTERMQAVENGKLKYDWQELIKMSQEKTKKMKGRK
ncbi:MAG: NADH-quinone oxidoreductase subunit C [Elusimicrobia bacterium]|nr:NADH-quinone oxidoreductase subunit C [Elusimicrobiota bacterium]